MYHELFRRFHHNNSFVGSLCFFILCSTQREQHPHPVRPDPDDGPALLVDDLGERLDVPLRGHGARRQRRLQRVDHLLVRVHVVVLQDQAEVGVLERKNYEVNLSSESLRLQSSDQIGAFLFKKYT